MFKGCQAQYYDINEILFSVNQEDLFFNYLGILPNKNGRFHSPFRSDKDPGCRFTYYSGILYLVENTMFNGKLYWSIIDCMKYLFNMSVNQCLETIALDYKITTKQSFIKNEKLPKDRPEIRFSFKKWEDNIFDLPNDVLIKENVFLVEDYWIGRNGNFTKNVTHNPRKTLCVAYYFPKSNHTKLYFPEEKENRWFSNCDVYDIFGFDKINYYLEQDNKKIIITKSQKDRLILDYHLGQNAIALQNEGCLIPPEFIETIKKFHEQFILFDNDKTGIEMSKKISEKYNFKQLFLHTGKDIYEIFKNKKENGKKIWFAGEIKYTSN